MAQHEGLRRRAVVVGVTGPIRAGKSWTTGNLIRALHPERFQKLLTDNWALLNGDPLEVGSYLRGEESSMWHSITPEQRLILCFDPWAKCENLDLSSVGLQKWRRHWAQDAFQIIAQDSFLSPAKNKPKMVKAILEAKARVDADESLCPFVYIEGYWLLHHTFFPENILPLLDYLVVLHASEDLVLQRNPKGSATRSKKAWDKECVPYLRELCRMFPWLCPPEHTVALSQDGVWHFVSDVVSCKTRNSWGSDCMVSVPNLQLWAVQFSAPGADSRKDPQSRVDDIVQQVVARLKKHGESGGTKRKREEEQQTLVDQ